MFSGKSTTIFSVLVVVVVLYLVTVVHRSPGSTKHSSKHVGYRVFDESHSEANLKQEGKTQHSTKESLKQEVKTQHSTKESFKQEEKTKHLTKENPKQEVKDEHPTKESPKQEVKDEHPTKESPKQEVKDEHPTKVSPKQEVKDKHSTKENPKQEVKDEQPSKESPKQEIKDEHPTKESPKQKVKEEHSTKSTTTLKPKAKKVEKKKLILSIDGGGPWLTSRLNFDGCEYSNCDLKYSRDNFDYALKADALIFFQRSTQSLLNFPPEVRQRQLWFAASMESPSYAWNRYYPIVNTFNGSMTYARNSVPDQLPYGRTENKTTKSYGNIDYAKNKTKGAYAYISNCVSQQYDRLELAKQLKRYINVDVFGGCTNRKPCPTKVDLKCEANLHSQYRFYLAFENTLCEDYVTEKFWKTLKNKGYIVPIAAGGSSVQEYIDIAPPDSFIHVYNFSSVETLGKYLQHLMTDDTAYNRYHVWHSSYSARRVLKRTVCGLCKAVNQPESIRAEQGRKFADERSYKTTCKSLDYQFARHH